MPAETAAAPGVTEATDVNATTSRTSQAQPTATAPAPEASVATDKVAPPGADRVARMLEIAGVEPEKADQPETQSHEEESQSQAAGGDRSSQETGGDRGLAGEKGGGRSPQGEARPQQSGSGEPETGLVEPGAGEDGEKVTTGSDPFKDARVQDRLSREARKRDRIMRAAGLSEEALDQIHQSADPVATAEQLLQQHRAASGAAAGATQASQLPKSDGLLGACTSEAQLDAWEANARAQLAFCRANKGGTTITENGEERFLTPEEIENGRDIYQQVLAEAPGRRQQIRDAMAQRTTLAQEASGVLQEHYGKWFEKNAAEHQELLQLSQEDTLGNSFLQRHPELATDPQYPVFVARYVAGLKSERKGKNGTVSELEPFTRPQPPIARTAPIVRPPTAKANGSGNMLKRAEEKLQEKPSDETRTNLVSALRASQRQTAGAPA